MNENEIDPAAMRREERQREFDWERATGKCSACGHALSKHNELAYCRSKTSHDGSGECICGSPNAQNRRLHLATPTPSDPRTEQTDRPDRGDAS